MGHEAVAFDLPGHGQDRTPIENITFRRYVERANEAVRMSEQPAVLVGHSMGGVIACQAAESLPAGVRAVVCIASLLPPNGSTMLGHVAGFDPDYLSQILWAPDRRSARLSPQGAARFLYSECTPTTIDSVSPLLTAEPAAPFDEPLYWTRADSVSVPHYYIECLWDRGAPIDLQRSMRSAVAFTDVFSLDTDHSPHFSRPGDLARILHTIPELC
jgi:pimeloyl-ACP methyl ester carboxylesterase